MKADINDPTECLKIKYRFCFEDGEVECHDVNLDPHTLELLDAPESDPSDWTRLEFHQCPNCPLSTSEYEHCPAALAVSGLARDIGHRDSFCPVNVQVETKDRTISRQTTLQEGLFPLLGLKMATSGCPVLDKVKPMARFHLPFADAEETVFRAISMYLVAQYLRQQKGLPARFDLQQLSDIYEAIHQVNMAFGKRLSKASAADANINSLTTLDIFAQEVPFGIDMSLTHLDQVFSPYLD